MYTNRQCEACRSRFVIAPIRPVQASGLGARTCGGGPGRALFTRAPTIGIYGSVGPPTARGIDFGDCRLRPLCWVGPRRRAPRVAAATTVRPPSSSGLGHRPFKAAARVRIPLGARLAHCVGRVWSCRAAWSARHPVKVEVAGSNPVRTAKGPVTVPMAGCRRPARSGSSVGTSVRLKSGRSAVRSCP